MLSQNEKYKQKPLKTGSKKWTNDLTYHDHAWQQQKFYIRKRPAKRRW